MKHASILRPENLGIKVEPISRCDLRVGAVSYLNTKPLIFGLQSLAPALRVRVAPPAQLARGLRKGELDVALVPVLEYFSNSDYGLIRSSALCGDGRIRSVLVFSRVPIRQVQTIRLDPESLTSNALLRILCGHQFMIMPRWVRGIRNLEPAAVLEQGKSDAVLVIGNRALAMSGRFPYEYDLGQEWWRLTRLPFVFAVWAVRPGAQVGDLPKVLARSLKLGLAHLDLIADTAARNLDLDPVLCLAYLRKMLRYELTERAWEGMARFFEWCARMRLCPSVPPRDLRRKMSGEDEGDEDAEKRRRAELRRARKRRIIVL